jgi:dsRNA-specific ribonuclease
MRGLASQEEEAKNLVQQIMSHLSKRVSMDERMMPVAILTKFCAHNNYTAPIFELVREEGPDHRKLFMYRVLVNEMYYQPTLSSPTKKEAKQMAAIVCLQAFRALPDDLIPKVTLSIECPEVS